MKKKISKLHQFVLCALITNCVYAAEKDFDFFEDCLGTNIYCNFNLSTRNPSHEEKEEVAERICDRKNEIVQFLQTDEEELTLNNLMDIDAYPLAQGILERALNQRVRKLNAIHLEHTQMTGRTADILFTALVNRGICDGWTKTQDGTNKLKDLTIKLPSLAYATSSFSKSIADQYHVFFVN